MQKERQRSSNAYKWSTRWPQTSNKAKETESGEENEGEDDSQEIHTLQQQQQQQFFLTEYKFVAVNMRTYFLIIPPFKM